MSLHFNIRLRIRVQDFDQFFKVNFSIIRQIRFVKCKKNITAEFHDDSFTNPLNLCIRNSLGYLFGLFVHLMTNYSSCSPSNSSTDNRAQSSIA